MKFYIMKLIKLYSFVLFKLRVFQKQPKKSHKKKSKTYESKQSERKKQLDRQRTHFDMFRKESLSTPSAVNNDEDEQITDKETEMQTDTSLENMTDVSDKVKKVLMAPMIVQIILKKMNLKFKMKQLPKKTTIKKKRA